MSTTVITHTRNSPLNRRLLRYWPVIARRSSGSGAWWTDGGNIPVANVMGAWAARGAATYAASQLDLTPNAKNLSDGAAFPTWDGVNGWTFVSASSQYLRTGITPTGSPGVWSAIVRFTNASGYVKSVLGAYEYKVVLDQSGFRINHQGPAKMRFSNGHSHIENATYHANGTAAIAGTKAFLDGSDLGLTIPSTGSLPTDEIFIGALNFVSGGGATNFHDIKIQALAIYNIDISAYIPSLHTRIMAI